jgi:hypothetical protein
MKRFAVVSLVLAALILGVMAPAAGASQGGISGPIPAEVAATIGWETPYLQLLGGNFQPGSATFPVSSANGAIVGTAYFRITRCQGFIGYRINVPGLDSSAKLAVKHGDATISMLDPVAVVAKPEDDGLHAEGFVTYADVNDAYRASPNPTGVPYPSIQKAYNLLESGDAYIVVTDAHGLTVSGAKM